MIDGMLTLYFKWILIYGLLFLGWAINLGFFIYGLCTMGKPQKTEWFQVTLYLVIPFGVPALFLYFAIEGMIRRGNRPF